MHLRGRQAAGAREGPDLSFHLTPGRNLLAQGGALCWDDSGAVVSTHDGPPFHDQGA
jgi:hypothetical protein